MAKIIPVSAPPPIPSAQPVQEEGVSSSRVDMRFIAKALLKYKASDVHIKVDRPPLFRINGKLIPAKMGVVSAEQCEAMVTQMLSPEQLAILKEKRQLDLSVQVDLLGRFRCNVFYQRGTLSLAIRLIPTAIPDLSLIIRR